MKPFSLLTLLFSIVLFSSCQKTREKVEKDFQKTARGNADEMVMVIDSAQWSSALGDELKKTFLAPIVGLPQDEPKFTVHNVNPTELNSTLKTAVNMVFVMTLDNESRQGKTVRRYFSNNSLKLIQNDTSQFITVKRDEFANGQLVVYLYAKSEEILLRKIKDNRSRLTELFESVVRERTRGQVLAKLEKTKMSAITENHGYSIMVPYGWDMAKNLKDFVWLRHLEAQSEYNVFIYERPYSDQNVFNDVGKLRDQITETYLRDAEKPELYIMRQPIIPVFTERVNFNGNFAVEGRGLWKNSDNSGGGPFVSFTLVDEKSQKLYYIEGYVYSPGTKKKPLVREVEAILSTFRTPSEQNASK